MIKIIKKYVVLGGAETLLLRIAEQCRKIGYKTELYCINLSDEMYIDFKKNCNKIVESDQPHQDCINSINDNDIVLTLLLDDFLDCEFYAKFIRINVKILCYVIHPYGYIFKIKYTLTLPIQTYPKI